MTADEIIKGEPGYISSLISSAYHRIHQHLQKTRLIHDEHYHLWLKCENEQETGSFKLRGALSKLSKLTPGEEIITASTGNHGLGVAHASKLYGLKAKIFIPSSASPKKIEKLQSAGVELIQVDGDSLSAELAGKKYASDHGLTWVSPYNDPDVIAGQGTIGLELHEALNTIDSVYVTVGGGGLISGIAGWLKHVNPAIKIIGCQPLNSPEMYLSVLAGHVVDAPDALPTLSDGSAGPLEEDSITFPLCKKWIDRFILVTEAEIEEAIRYLYSIHQLVVEGAAGVALAAAMKDELRNTDNDSAVSGKSGKSVVVLCGGNIDPKVHQRICGY